MNILRKTFCFLRSLRFLSPLRGSDKEVLAEEFSHDLRFTLLSQKSILLRETLWFSRSLR